MKQEKDSHCVEFKKGGTICGVSEFMGSTNAALGELMQFKEDATAKLDRIEHLETALGKVADHAESMDGTLKGMADTAKQFMEAATGGKHVPIKIFYAVVFFLAAWMLVDKLASQRGELEMTPTGFKYRSPQLQQSQP